MDQDKINAEKLIEMTVEKINDYLAGKLSEKEASEWALGIVKKFPIHDSDIAFAMMDLMCLDEPERFRTAKEDLTWRKDHLTAKKSSEK